MQAILLAAGYGNRMRPLTDNVHKTLLDIGGRTIIGRILDGLEENGVLDIGVVTGYRDQELREHLLQHHPGFRFTFVHNPRYRETNNIHSLALGLQQLPIESDVILIESDLVCEPDVFRRICQTPHANAALLDRWKTGMDGTVVTIADGLVHQVIPPHLQVGEFSFADKYKTLNIYKFSKEFCRTGFKQLLTFYAQTFDDNCYYELVLGMLIYMRQADIHAEVVDGLRWAEVDDPNDVRIAEFVFDPAARTRILDESMGGYWAHDVLDFCFIRNMHFPPPAVFAEVRANLTKLLHNYGSKQAILDQKLAYLLLRDVQRLRVLNGASQLYPLLGHKWGTLKTLLPTPTFGEYPRWFPHHETYADQPGMDWTEILGKAQDAELVIFVNPNNPTGTVLETAKIVAFARQNPHKKVVVDESFIEFTGQPSILDTLDVEPLTNVLVLKSLSKSLGIPGVRLGYAYTADADLHREIGAWLPIWNLNSVAEHLLEILLKHRRTLTESYARTIADRQQFLHELAELPCVAQTWQSGADFVLVRMHEHAAPDRGWTAALLDRHSILVKDVSPKLKGGTWLRFAVRLPEEHRRLCQALLDVAADRQPRD